MPDKRKSSCALMILGSICRRLLFVHTAVGKIMLQNLPISTPVFSVSLQPPPGVGISASFEFCGKVRCSLLPRPAMAVKRSRFTRPFSSIGVGGKCWALNGRSRQSRTFASLEIREQGVSPLAAWRWPSTSPVAKKSRLFYPYIFWPGEKQNFAVHTGIENLAETIRRPAAKHLHEFPCPHQERNNVKAIDFFQRSMECLLPKNR